MSLLLDVEEIDRDLFRALAGPNSGPRETLYGGQVAAQALAAAGRTVEAERVPHSLHGYFLRPGDPERPVIYHVHRDRDGGSFSARQVQAVQGGEVIFSMLASFHAEKPSEDLFELTPGPRRTQKRSRPPGGASWSSSARSPRPGGRRPSSATACGSG